MAPQDFSSLPFHSVNSDLEYFTPVMPLPMYRENLPYRFNEYSDVPDEPKFDPDIHLALDEPSEVTRLPDFQRVKTMEGETPGSLAYSQPVKLLSDEGVRVMRQILEREKPKKMVPARGSRVTVRGLYYRSPWIRDLQSNEKLLDLVSKIAGERLVPSHFNNSTPQVNFSIPGLGGTSDFWHWDSVCYVANFLLSDPSTMVGGDLEIIKMEKEAGMRALVGGTLEPAKVEKLVYGPPGNMVLAQGSEILHHVTQIESELPRIVCILCFCPANVFKPDKMVLYTEEQADKAHGHDTITAYEFFRGKAWVCGQGLTGMVSQVKHTEDRNKLAERLRSVATELERVSGILDGSLKDHIGFYDENANKHAVQYNGK